MSEATSKSVWSIGLRGRCPRCGKGKLFHQILNVREKCDQCGLSYRFADAGDGPSIFVLFILGAVMVGLALFFELTYEPPLWLHAVLWAPITMGLAIAMLRPMKGVLIALQYHNKAEQGVLVQRAAGAEGAKAAQELNETEGAVRQSSAADPSRATNGVQDADKS